jgi:hypothetical protein
MPQNHEDMAIAGAACAPLGNVQKMLLAQAAGRAFAVQVDLGLWDPKRDGDAETFRHAACFDACGVSSARAMQQRHYAACMAYLCALAGGEVSALRSRAAGDDARRALARLRLECDAQAGAYGGSEGAWAYAQALLRRIHKVDAAQASPRQLWQVLFTLRNRGRARMRQDGPGRAGAAKTRPADEDAVAGFRGALPAAQKGGAE